ncbi:MAG: 30S ribosomal protein S14 [Gammaproteobacteria bacterium]|nr:MAG: 30S ribosomal protein S14 [Gammaproteobacteria bacterium]
MAKKSMIAREVKRKATVARFATKRADLRAKIKSLKTPEEERDAAILALQKLPRNASPCRGRNRCQMTGRSRGYYRKFGLSRNRLREVMNRGEVPGAIKSSW